MAQLDAMSRLRLILGAGACSIALSGCIPAAAGLALSAASILTDGGGTGNGNAFRNPIDRHSTGRQVREALSRLDDQVDPACQAMLDEQPNAAADPKDAPRNLLAKLEPETAGKARSAETAAPGQCEHRLVCLPGTPKPTLMLMCPGKGGKTTVASETPGDTPGSPQEGAADSAAAVAADKPGPETPAGSAAAGTPEPIPAAAPQRGVADWNWSYDPSKRL